MNVIEFGNKLERLVQSAATTQVRLDELKEFEKQWKNIFDHLIPTHGSEVKIKIANQMLLETYQYDKYHIICDDLLSLIENEIRSEFSVCRNAAEHLSIRKFEQYLKDENDIEYRQFRIDAKTGEKTFPDEVPDFVRHDIANQRRNSHLEDFHFLFGKGAKETQAEFLVNQLRHLSEDIKGLRNLFSHRYEYSIQQRYVRKWDEFNFSKFELWFKRFFEIIQKIFIVFRRVHHRGMVSTWTQSVSDQLDLILFGTVDQCIDIFCKNSENKPYSIARKEFYASDSFADLLVASGNQASN